MIDAQRQVEHGEELVHVIRRRGGPRSPADRERFERAAATVAEARQRLALGCTDLGIPPLVWAIGVLLMLAGPAKCTYDAATSATETTKAAFNWLAFIAVVGAAGWVGVQVMRAAR